METQAPETAEGSSVSPPRRYWYRTWWAAGLAGLLIGLAIGGGVAIGTSKQAALEDAQGDAARLSEQLDAAREANTELSSENADLRSDIGASEGQVADLEAEVKRLEAKLAEKRSAPTTPNQGLFDVDYSEWAGLFRISGLTLDYDFGWDVLGQIEYLGGGDCPLGYVEVEATFFDGNTIVATDFTNFTTLPQGSPRVLEIFGPEQKPTSVRVTVAEATCE
jgi:hypothetical protein